MKVKKILTTNDIVQLAEDSGATVKERRHGFKVKGRRGSAYVPKQGGILPHRARVKLLTKLAAILGFIIALLMVVL